jgi:hypothetical protein
MPHSDVGIHRNKQSNTAKVKVNSIQGSYTASWGGNCALQAANCPKPLIQVGFMRLARCFPVGFQVNSRSYSGDSQLVLLGFQVLIQVLFILF